MGRKSSGRNAKIEVRCTEDQKSRWQGEAEAEDKDLSEWIRAACDAYYRDQRAKRAVARSQVDPLLDKPAPPG